MPKRVRVTHVMILEEESDPERMDKTPEEALAFCQAMVSDEQTAIEWFEDLHEKWRQQGNTPQLVGRHDVKVTMVDTDQPHHHFVEEEVKKAAEDAGFEYRGN